CTVDSLRNLINTGSSYRSGAPTQHNDYSEADRYLYAVFTFPFITPLPCSLVASYPASGGLFP
ncbi:TPA: hypothetical protein ACXGGA_005531, partial [Klebsiella pneumoniae]